MDAPINKVDNWFYCCTGSIVLEMCFLNVSGGKKLKPNRLSAALLLDLLLVRLLKALVRRQIPVQNRSDILSALFAERYSFPSGHATRAAMCARFFLAQLSDTASTRFLVVGWSVLVSLSRLLLARNYVTDVGFGLAMGFCQYSLVERLWVTWDGLRDLLFLRLRERLNWVYGGLWMDDWTY